jgi:hypothetical protein
MVPDMERAMTPTTFCGKTAGVLRILLQACLFVAVTAAVFTGMMAIDRPERLSTFAYMQCPDCSHGTGSPDRLQVDSNTDSRLRQLLQLLHPGEGRGGGMAAILRE